MSRGSQMHVLDWVEQPTFVDDLLTLVQPVRCTRDAATQWMPKGYPREGAKANAAEARLETFGPRAFPEMPPHTWKELHSWWIKHTGNTPNWDIALRAKVEGAPGLILVEAKANHPELTRGGAKRPFRANPKQSPEDQKRSQARSKANDTMIRRALEDAQAALASQVPGIALNTAKDYQLSNRIAFAWKLASLGIPTVLVYLGFVGDAGIEAAGRSMFRDKEDWASAFSAQLTKVAPMSILERPISTERATFWMLSRSGDIRRDSPAVIRAHGGAAAGRQGP